MADDQQTERLDVQEDEQDEEGGPVKSFLEHLEDLRWVLIKSLTAAGVAMLACLLAGNYLVTVLEWPLKRAPVYREKGQVVRLSFGTNLIANITVGTNDTLAALAGTNRFTRLDLVPVTVGTNQFLGVQVRHGNQIEPVPGKKLPIDIVNMSPAGSFIVATKVAFFGGLVIASPFIFYYIAQFVFPALRMREKKYVYTGLTFAVGLFMVGVSFCYFILMPIALAASAHYAEWLGFSAYQWRAEEYISFVSKFMIGMGLGFELPVVVLTLVKLGVITYKTLSSARRYVIVLNFILGAVLTTPEVITQVLMAIPLQILYEISVLIAWHWYKQDQKRAAALEEEERRGAQSPA